jgi:hypothetical protein
MVFFLCAQDKACVLKMGLVAQMNTQASNFMKGITLQWWKIIGGV